MSLTVKIKGFYFAPFIESQVDVPRFKVLYSSVICEEVLGKRAFAYFTHSLLLRARQRFLEICVVFILVRQPRQKSALLVARCHIDLSDALVPGF